MVAWLEGKQGRAKKKEAGRGYSRIEWTREAKERLKREIRWVTIKGKGMEEEIGVMQMEIRRVIQEIADGNKNKKIETRGWWDGKCKEGKKEVRKALRAWRKGKEELGRYKEKMRKYKEFIDKKKEEQTERYNKELDTHDQRGCCLKERKTIWRRSNRERGVGRIISMERKRIEGVSREIKNGRMEQSFYRTVGGSGEWGWWTGTNKKSTRWGKELNKGGNREGNREDKRTE